MIINRVVIIEICRASIFLDTEKILDNIKVEFESIIWSAVNRKKNTIQFNPEYEEKKVIAHQKIKVQLSVNKLFKAASVMTKKNSYR